MQMPPPRDLDSLIASDKNGPLPSGHLPQSRPPLPTHTSRPVIFRPGKAPVRISQHLTPATMPLPRAFKALESTPRPLGKAYHFTARTFRPQQTQRHKTCHSGSSTPPPTCRRVFQRPTKTLRRRGRRSTCHGPRAFQIPRSPNSPSGP